ncbi:MAG: 50S ribosomal protein L25 [Patescibacteria group bacterium]|jgi:large subunit ribosomal protein L25
METKLTAQIRADKEKLSPDFIPAVLYGKGIKNQSLKIKKADFDRAFSAAGESNLIDLAIDGQSVKVLVKDTQHDVLKHSFTHADFYQVNMKEKVNAEIPLHFIGEAKAIKELGGTLMKDLTILEVECLPSDLVDHIDVDISVLNTFDDIIRVNDVTLPKGMVLVHHTNEVIAAVKEPKIEEEPVATPAETAPAGEKTEAKSEEKK